MKRGAFCTLWLTVLLTGFPLQAQENLLMKALRDEMGRTMERLQLEDMDRPYYVAYWVRESTGRGSEAILGGLLGRGRGSGSRFLSVELRVGDHDLDNTNFMDFSRLRSRVVREGFPVSLPLRDDYRELRRQIWLATDGAYKQAVHSLAKKRATLQNKTRVEEIPDFSREEPVEYRDDGSLAPLPDEARVEAAVQELSALFKGMPHIFDSRVRARLSTREDLLRQQRGFFLHQELLLRLHPSSGGHPGRRRDAPGGLRGRPRPSMEGPARPSRTGGEDPGHG